MYAQLPQTDGNNNSTGAAASSRAAISELSRRRLLVVIVVFAGLFLATGALVVSLGRDETSTQNSHYVTDKGDSEGDSMTGIDEVLLDGYGIEAPDNDNNLRLVELKGGEDPKLVEKPKNGDELRVNEVPDEESVVNERIPADDDAKADPNTEKSGPNDEADDNNPTQRIPKADLGQCKYWTRHVRETFPKECGYWLDVVNEWENAVNPASRKFSGYSCSGGIACHGWGDRLAGILSAFFKALNSNVAFKIDHEYLAKLFQPCALGNGNRATDWTKHRFKYQQASQACVDSNIPCKSLFNLECKLPGIVGVHTNRVCLDSNRCHELRRIYNESLSAVHSMGCSSRLLLEPSADLFENVNFPFKYDGQMKPMSIKQIQELFEDKYYVITVQMRLGDRIAFQHRDKQLEIIRRDRRRLTNSFKCASTIENYFKDEINGKPVRYFLATDTYEYRKYMESVLGDKLMAFDFLPEHIGKTSQKFGLAKELAEWYLLGLGEKLILNKMGLENQYYEGRISSFSKTAWVYNLKHWVFDAGTCRNYSITLDGTWDDVRGRGCDNPILRQPTLQNHMLALVEKNLSFPNWYVAPNGQLVKGVFRLNPGEPSSAEQDNEEEDADAQVDSDTTP